MLRRTIIAALAALSFGIGLHAQEILSEPGPYVPIGVDISDVAAMVSEGQFEAAMDSLELMMPADSAAGDALLYYRGKCRLGLGQFAEAAADFERAIALDPGNSSYYEELYAAYSYMGREASADSLHLQMARLFPRKYRTPYILTKLGEHAWIEERNDSLAMRYFEEALAADDQYPPALYAKAELSLQDGNYLGYFSTVEALVRANGLAADVKASYLDRVVERLDGPTYRVWHNQIDGIMDAFVQTHPTDSAALVPAGRWFYSTEQKDKGIAYFKQWKDSNPWNYSAASLWISVTMQEGTDKDVIAACDEALKIFSKPRQRVELLCIKADCLYKTGRKSKAFSTYEKALRADPANLTVLNNYAYFLSLERLRLKKAEKMSHKAVEGDPDNVSYLDTYGYILYLLKRPAEAKTYFKRAIIYGGKEDEAVLRHYYLVLEALGEKELAVYYRSLYEAKSRQK